MFRWVRKLLYRRVAQHGWYQQCVMVRKPPRKLRNEDGLPGQEDLETVYWFDVSKTTVMNNLRRLVNLKMQEGFRVRHTYPITSKRSHWDFPIWSREYWTDLFHRR